MTSVFRVHVVAVAPVAQDSSAGETLNSVRVAEEEESRAGKLVLVCCAVSGPRVVGSTEAREIDISKCFTFQGELCCESALVARR